MPKDSVADIRAQLNTAAERVALLQGRYPLPSDTWHELETIDDCLFEISRLIGD